METQRSQELQRPVVSMDIIVVRGDQMLLGLLSDDWLYEGQKVYGLPGRELQFGETFGEAVHRDIEEEIGCKVTSYNIISVNSNRAYGNHFVGIGVVAHIEGEVTNNRPHDWDRWEWVDVQNIPENLFPPARNAIESFLQQKITVSE